MRLGVAIEETWDFFHEVHAELAAYHQTTLYARPPALRLPALNGRVNGYRFRRHFEHFLRGQEVVFFEWASSLLADATHLPRACAIVTRLHRYELYQWAHRVNWDRVDRLILVSQAKLREFATLFPAHAHKAVVIPEAVSLDRFPMADRTFAGNIGILCHLKPRKRVYELVLTFSELLRQRPGLHLHIGGGRALGFEEYAEAISQLVTRLGLSGKVTFHGHVDKPEEWYPAIDIFISNGYSEGLQVSPMEAMATGCYALSHQWDGADELLPPEHLYFTDRELQERILRYVDMPEPARQEMRAAMRARVSDRFNVDVTKRRIRLLVEDAAAGRAA
jgi:glycosyltransferase involved in cell wall biosynthesis